MMEEYISRAKTLKAIKGSVSEVFNIASNAGRMHQKITEIVESVPAADVAPVVRCRECKHWGGVDEYGDGYCKNPDGIDNIAKENDFCSYGEKANK